jgi:glycosyltransferase involved in cell wall biosynthesis
MTPRPVFFILGVLGPGGQQWQILTILRGLDRSRWTPVVIGTMRGTLVDTFAAECDVHVLRAGPMNTDRFWHLRELIDRYKPSLIHTFLFTGNTWGRLATTLDTAHRPVVVMQEGAIDTWKSPLHRVVDRALLGVTDAVVGNSQAVCRFLVERERVPENIVYAIPNGIALTRAQNSLGESLESRSERRNAFDIQDGHFVVGHIGRFDPVKGLDVLLDTFTELHREIPEARLLRVAQPPLPKEIAVAEKWQHDVELRGLGDCIIHHPYTNDVSAVYALCDAVVQTSWREGLSNVVMEAMAMERPVVATAAGGTPEVVRHGETGWCVPPGDVEGLVEGLRYVHDQPDEANSWGKAARRLIENEYTEDLVVERTVALYEMLLQRRGI